MPNLFTPIKVKVIGVGGSGSNTVSRMMTCKIKGVDLIALNTDLQDLKETRAHSKIQIGKNLTGGLGTGMNPELGRLAAQENREEIKRALIDADMVFVTCGLGGGTGTGAAPVVAEIAREGRALTVAVVTKPFSFEGIQRMRIAKKGLEQLRERVDTLLVIPNDKILSLIDHNATIVSAFWMCDEVLRQAVQGISDLISFPGIINVDFAGVRSVMKNSGTASFGMGRVSGERRIEMAVKQATHSPLLGLSIEGAKGVLFNISSGGNLSLNEINEAAKIIAKLADREAKIIFGATRDSKLKKNEVKITLIATGFPLKT